MAGTFGAMAVDYPDAFKGGPASRVEEVPFITGTAYSSHAPASWWFHPLNMPSPAVVSNIYVYKSMNASVPGATSQASTGTARYSYKHGVSIFQRQDYGANSSRLSFVGSASGGITAGVSYSSSSQSFVMSWVTDTTGGVSTYGTTSNAGNWSSFATGVKMIRIPLVSAFAAGEYFVAHQHSSTSGTTNSNVTLLSFSNLHIAPQVLTYGILGASSASVASVGGPAGMGFGVASAVTTNATMEASVVSASVQQHWVQNYSPF